MKLDTNDPRLTAYALGELDEDCAEFERLLDEDPLMRRLVEELKTTAEDIRESVSVECGPELESAVRAGILAEARGVQRFETPVLAARPRRRWGAVLAFSAITFFVFGAALVIASGLGRAREAARRSHDVPALVAHAFVPNTDYRVVGPSPVEQFHQQTAQEGFPSAPDSAALSPGPPNWPFVESRGLTQSTAPAPSDQNPVRLDSSLAGSHSQAHGRILTTFAANSPEAGGPLKKQENLDAYGYLGDSLGLVGPDPLRTAGRAGLEWREAPKYFRSDGTVVVRTWIGQYVESYASVPDSPFVQVSQQPLSTFSIDVDTASYSNVRRYLTQGQLPPADAVRIEEMINYFEYEYAPPQGGEPFAVHIEAMDCPWKPEHRLVRIGLKGREIAMDDREPANFVFLLDVSGSMDEPNKLPLLKEGMKLLARKLNAKDRVAIVTYRDAANVALASTPCDNPDTIVAAIDSLEAKGSTNGASGLALAYDIATQNFVSGGLNRVILATDGDFNVGETKDAALVELIRERAGRGMFLTVLGFGEGNLKDDRLDALADKGNGNYYYIDSFNEANRVLVQQMGGTLAAIAKDVKIQIEFNPVWVGAYRLIGYENRALAPQDFKDDRIDAGEIGSGHTVTALYEIVPPGLAISSPEVDPLKYQQRAAAPPEGGEVSREAEAARPVPDTTRSAPYVVAELLTVKLRWKEPNAETSDGMETPYVDRGLGYDQASRDTRWAAAIAAFGMVLRNSPHKGNADLDLVQRAADEARGFDPNGHRAEFMSLIVTAKTLSGSS
jgi:Ca-activated chloride channel family protein